MQAGLFIPGDAKAIVKLRGPADTYLLAASQNRGQLKLFSRKSSGQKLIPLQQTDKSVNVTLANGKKRKEELYFGDSFLSQSSRFLPVNKNVAAVEIKDSNGKVRRINL